MDGYQKQINEGIQLRSNKEMAVAKRKEVAGSINFAQELLGVLNLLTTEVSIIKFVYTNFINAKALFSPIFFILAIFNLVKLIILKMSI